MLIILMKVDNRSSETEILIAICHLSGDKWPPKTLFLGIFDPSLSIVWSIFNCRLSGVIMVLGVSDSLSTLVASSPVHTSLSISYIKS